MTKRTPPPEQTRQRPLTIGLSVGHFRVTAGTLGCFVRRPRSRRAVYILSNNHVLADENGGRRGDEILQPGRIDGGRRPRDVVARLDTYVRLRTRAPNEFDCALARVDADVELEAAALGGIGTLVGAVAPDGVDRVEKIGRTTAHTSGRITAFELDNVVVGYELGDLRFDNQVEIDGDSEPFSRPGDSGSLVFTAETRQGVGLLFAGSDHGGSHGFGLTFANPLESVLDRLAVEVAV